MDIQKRLKTVLSSFILEDAVEVGDVVERGAYSSEVRVRWQGTVFSGKKLHDLPLRLEKKKGEEILTRLRKHCEVLVALHHPNIVQYVGVTLSAHDYSPILINECLPSSVALSLGSHTRFPPPAQLSILQDVGQGLAYLHCRPKPLVHGSLNSYNVLLSRGLQAKISDMGVAAILEPSSGKMTVTLTKSPEIESFISPEDSVGVSTAPSSDIFSYGVLALHIASSKWPLPVGDSKAMKEIEKRKTYIDGLPSNHCLVSLIQDCLHNDPLHRPNALNLIERLTRLTSQYPLGFQTALELMIIMERREGELVTMVDQLKAGQEEVAGIGKRLSTYDVELAAVKEQMKTMEESLVGGLGNDQTRERIAKGLLKPPPNDTVRLSTPEKETSTPILKPTQSVFHWKRGPSSPVGMHSATAIVLEGKLYIGGGETKELQTDRTLYEYDISGMLHKWTPLPVCPVAYYALGVVNKSLVLVGGVDVASRKTSSKLYMWDRERQEWSTSLPPMPTARQNPAVTTHNLMLIVAGGYRNKKVLNEVEIFDMATFQWIVLPPLVIPTSAASSCVVRDILYVLGGSLYGDTGSSTVVQAISLSGDFSSSVWSVVKECPLTKSYAVPSSNFLLGVGGCLPGSDTPNSGVYAYFPAIDRWKQICNMPTPRNKCIAAVLSAGRLIVIGGKEEQGGRPVEYGTTVEMLTV